MTDRKAIIIILALSIATHFAFFGHPNETVFDEVHFGKFVSGYYTGEYYFDIHPPLGKLMIAGFAKIFDFQPDLPAGEAGFNFAKIGAEFPDKKYLVLRFLPILAGTLLPVIIFLLALQIGISKIGAFTAGLLVVFDNALLTQSRLILLDPFLLLFGFTSLLFYFKHLYRSPKQHKKHSNILQSSFGRLKHGQEITPRQNVGMFFDWNLVFMAIFSGLAISIKWTGLSFIALPILIEAAKNFKIPKTGIKLAIASFIPVFKFASFFVISLAIYFSVFALHFALLPKPGHGDAFMSSGFRESGVVSKFIELNREMYSSNQRLTATHPYSSQWYAWPLMTRPIYYWIKDNARVYFFGNPVIWWTSAAAVAAALWTMGYGLWNKFKKHPEQLSVVHKPLVILLTAYWLNLLPFIGIKRVMFLYHYLAALVFAILILIYLLDKTKNAKRNFGILVVVSIIAFFFFAPLSYGLPLSDKAYSARVWFTSWR